MPHENVCTICLGTKKTEWLDSWVWYVGRIWKDGGNHGWHTFKTEQTACAKARRHEFLWLGLWAAMILTVL